MVPLQACVLQLALPTRNPGPSWAAEPGRTGCQLGDQASARLDGSQLPVRGVEAGTHGSGADAQDAAAAPARRGEAVPFSIPCPTVPPGQAAIELRGDGR